MKRLVTCQLVVFLLAGMAMTAKAQDTLTVAEGSQMLEYLPLSHNFPDGQQHTQMIYPAEMLQEIEGNMITALSFHMMYSTILYNGSPTIVQLGTTTQTTYAAADETMFLSTAGMTVVFNDTLHTDSTRLTILFSEPYVYGGGNLVIDIYYDGAGPMYGSGGHFYGISTGQRSGLMMYNYPEYNESDVYGPFMLPTVDFIYDEGGTVCLSPIDLTIDNISPHTADLGWTPRAEGQTFEVRVNGEVAATGLTQSSYALTGLDPETDYTVLVTATCEGGDSSAAAAASFTTAVACPVPSGFMVTGVTESSISFSWNAGSTATEWAISIDGEALETNYANTSYTATGLSHSTGHRIELRANCGTEGFSGAIDTIVATLCADITETPYSIGFEDGLMGCWRVIDGNWAVTTAGATLTAHSGTHMLRDYIIYNNIETHTVLMPTIVLPSSADGLQLSWYAAKRGTSPCTYTVYIGPGNATVFDTATFSAVLTDTLTVNNDYQKRSIDLSAYAESSVTVAFCHNSAEVQPVYTYLMIDDLLVGYDMEPDPMIGRYSYRYGSPDACVMVGEEARFEAWLVSGDEDNLMYTWTSARAAEGLASMQAADGVLTMIYSQGGRDTITLTAENNYGSRTLTLAVNIDTFDLATLPFSASFNTTVGAPAEFAKWCNISLDSTTTSAYRLFTPAHSGIYAVGSYALPDGGQTDAMLVSQAIAVPAETEHMSLIYHVNARSADSLTAGTYEVLVSTGGRSSYLYFTDTVLRDTVMPGNQYTPKAVPLSGYAGETVYIAFRHTSVGAQSIAFDDIEIREAAEPIVGLASYQHSVEIGDTLVLSAVLAQGDSISYSWTSSKLASGEADTTMLADSVMAIVYSHSGFDHITVTAANAFGSSTASANITVTNPAGAPTVVITGPNSATVGIEATFVAVQQTGDTTSVAYTWSSAMAEAGLATMIADSNILHITYSEAGTDQLSVTIDNGIGTMTNSLNIEVLPAPCYAPTNFVATSADSASATFGWTAGGDEGEWEVAIGGTVEVVAETHYTATGLEADTDYMVTVRAICGEGDTSEMLVGMVHTAAGTTPGPGPGPGPGEGIDDAEGTAFSIHPNPATSVATVQCAEGATVTVTDMNGREVYKSDIRSRKTEIDVSRLAKGAYFVRITSAEGTAARKLIVR